MKAFLSNPKYPSEGHLKVQMGRNGVHSPTHVQNLELGTYEGHVIKVNDGMLNLTNMWKACGEDMSQKPTFWLRQNETQKLIEAMIAKSKVDPESTLTEIKMGRYGGTFAHPVIGLAYAKYLSPEFHIWCNEKLLESGLIEVSGGELLVKLGRSLTRKWRVRTAFSSSRHSATALLLVRHH